MARLGRDELDGKTESHQAIPEGQVSRAMETGSLVCILARGLFGGKTEYLRVKDEYGNEYSVKGTNSNHGDFEYTEKSHPGVGWPAPSCSANTKENEKKHKR